jgi:hypothetical protein
MSEGDKDHRTLDPVHEHFAACGGRIRAGRADRRPRARRSPRPTDRDPHEEQRLVRAAVHDRRARLDVAEHDFGDLFSEQTQVNIRQHALESASVVVCANAWLDPDQQAQIAKDTGGAIGAISSGCFAIVAPHGTLLR